jgi:hypothetical protein
MPITSYIATLSQDPALAQTALCALAADERLEVGSKAGCRVAFVAETATPEEDAVLVRALLAREGVLAVDLVYVDFSDTPTFDRDAFSEALRKTRS